MSQLTISADFSGIGVSNSIHNFSPFDMEAGQSTLARNDVRGGIALCFEEMPLPDPRGVNAIWQATLSLLRSCQEGDGNDSKNDLARSKSMWHRTSAVKVDATMATSFVFSCIERIGPNMLLVSWHEATMGRYSEQRWIGSTARTEGVCALTRLPIVPGSRVYRPVSRVTKEPINSGAMLLDTSVKAYLEKFADVADTLD